ncbi:MAG: hypothetical protein GY711_02005 [bacterium]|nr:hypothetical protein [bacterium]
MKNRAALVALGLLAPLAFGSPSLPQQSTWPPGLEVGALVGRLAPADLQALIEGAESPWRVTELSPPWAKLVPEREIDRTFDVSVWIDARAVKGIMLATPKPEPPPSRQDVLACKKNLVSIAQGLLEYKAKYKRLPAASGTGFIAALITDRVWENSAANARRLTCPGASGPQPSGLRGKLPDEWFINRDSVDETYSAYWGRDTANHPLRKFPTAVDEVLVACDRHTDADGKPLVVAVHGDSTVRDHAGADLLSDGQPSSLGPDSAVPMFRKLLPK